MERVFGAIAAAINAIGTVYTGKHDGEEGCGHDECFVRAVQRWCADDITMWGERNAAINSYVQRHPQYAFLHQWIDEARTQARAIRQRVADPQAATEGSTCGCVEVASGWRFCDEHEPFPEQPPEHSHCGWCHSQTMWCDYCECKTRMVLSDTGLVCEHCWEKGRCLGCNIYDTDVCDCRLAVHECRPDVCSDMCGGGRPMSQSLQAYLESWGEPMDTD